MERNEARQEIRRRWREFIPELLPEAKARANNEASYICPYCSHGKTGDGLTFVPGSQDGATLKCFSCGWTGDIIDLYQNGTGESYSGALSLMAKELAIDIDPYRIPGTADGPKNGATTAQKTDDSKKQAPGHGEKAETQETAIKTPTEATADYTAYYEQCRQRLADPAAAAYLRSRGISQETAAAYFVGFDPQADPANAPGAMGSEYRPHPAPRIICPTTSAHYVGRSIDKDTGKRYQKLNPPQRLGAGSPGIFNQSALYAQGVQAVFVAEGFFNALSFLEIGAAAIATNSASNRRRLLDLVKKYPPAAPLILAFDNDQAGRTATEEMAAELKGANIPFLTAGPDIIGRADAGEDANDLLAKDRAAFTAAVRRMQQKTAARPDSTAFYIDAIMAGDIERFKKPIPTGFDELDKKTGGGLNGGLYLLAAPPSVGKTTFCLQMADQIAAAGNDVIFFSLEQSRLELVSKSIARKAYQADHNTRVNNLNIRRGELGKQAIEAASAYKKEVGDRLSIIEGNFGCDLSFIGDYTRAYIRRTGARPVVVVDYLQIMQPAPEDRRAGTKEQVDILATGIKKLSRELDTPIIAICSENRTNYAQRFSFESLKESGSLEFSADVVWGLQLQCLNEPLFDQEKNTGKKRNRINEAKAEEPRKIELSCLKNRFGKASFSVYFDYYTAHDYFAHGIPDYGGWAPAPHGGKSKGKTY